MHIRVSREMLMGALAKVGGVVERRQTLPILGNFLLSAQQKSVEVTGTDLEVEISTGTEAEVVIPGEVTLPARKFLDITRALPEGIEISLKVEGDRASIVAGRSRFILSTLPAGDFPIMDYGAEIEMVEVERDALKNLLDKTSFAMANQDVRYYLNGLLLVVRESAIVAVATDGHRLAMVEGKLQLGRSMQREIILPRKSVMELNRLVGGQNAEEIYLDVGDKFFRSRIGPTVLTSKLIDGRYPDYERVVPPVPERVVYADKEALRQALMRTVILSNEKFRGVRLTLGQGKLTLQAQNPEREEAEEELEVSYSQEPAVIGFNAQYLLDVLNVLEQDEVEIGFKDADSSAIVRNRDREHETFVVMPMRL